MTLVVVVTPLGTHTHRLNKEPVLRLITHTNILVGFSQECGQEFKYKHKHKHKHKHIHK